MRSLANGTYTHEEMDAALRAGEGAIGSRYEILDRDFQVLDELDTVDNEPGAARVELNAERDIKGTLGLRLRPCEALRDRMFTRFIRPWFRYRMPDNGIAELPMGVYLWSIPERELEPFERWQVALGDLSHWLDLGGPTRAGFGQYAGTKISDALKLVLTYAGLSDFSRIAETGETLPATVIWSLTLPRTFNVYGISYTVENAPVTWLRIAYDLCASVGYDPLWFDLEGRPVAQPSKDLATATPDIIYRDGQDGVRLSPLRTQVDVSKIANRFFVRSNVTTVYGTQLGEADANTVVPGHPLSEAKTGVYIDSTLPENIAGTQAALDARARSELYRALSLYERTSTPSLAYPAHENFEVVGLQIPGDAEFDTLRVFNERSWSMDLHDGEMDHEWARVYQPAA